MRAARNATNASYNFTYIIDKASGLSLNFSFPIYLAA